MPSFYFNSSGGTQQAFESFTESEIIDAVTNHVSQNYCYGSRAVREMRIKDIQNSPIYLYTLKLCVEERSSSHVTEPYRGENVDIVPRTSKEPTDLWSISVPAPSRFPEGGIVVDVPGTVNVVNCGKCKGGGSVPCEKCSGTALVACPLCFGGGVLTDPADPEQRKHCCPGCRGSGRSGCAGCETRGVLPCKTCLGFRRVKLTDKMEVKWRTNYVKSTRRTGKIGVKVGMLKGLVRTFVAEDSGSSTLSEPEMNLFNKFRPVLEQELTRFQTMPRHRVVDIQQRIFSFPGTEAIYQWKDFEETFLVYGKEKRVKFASNYPVNCWNFRRCNIL